MTTKILNENTRKVLQELTSLNDKFVLRTPYTVFSDEYKQVICAVNFEKLKENFDTPISVNEMSLLLNSINLINDPEITIENRIINIKNNTSAIKYMTSDENSIEESKYSIIESTKKVDSIISFKLTSDLINIIKQAKSVFKDSIDTLFIKKSSDTNDLILSLSVNESFNSATNEFDITLKADEYKFNDSFGISDFSVKVPIDNFLKIPNLNYDLEIKYNKDKDSFRIYIYNTLIEIVASTIK
jgi:ABC-type oligopeptide transport system ATPase subunit